MYNFLKGVGVALVTPFTKNLAVDYNSLDILLNNLIKSDISYILVHGTTGESATTSLEEKIEILKFVLKTCKEKKKVLLGLGGNNTFKILKHIDKFDYKGIEAIVSICPYYNKPTPEGLYKHYKVISENAPVPIILYNVPSRTSIEISANIVLELSKLKNIIGIKESSSNFSEIFKISNFKKNNFHLICGNDSDIIPMSALGSYGVISVLANAYPNLICALLENCLKNNYAEARKIASNFYDIDKLMYLEGNPVGIKQLLSILNITKNYVRLPLCNGSRFLNNQINKILQKSQYLNY